MTSITHTPVTLTNHEEVGDVFSVTIFANELSRDGVSVDIDGMDFSNYQQEPRRVVRTRLQRHDRVERTPHRPHREPGRGRVDGRIRADFEFLSGDPFADRVRNAWNRGFLRGASIGWRAIEARPSERGRGLRIVKSELIEWSIVAVPADPDALRGAYTRVMRALIEPGHARDSPAKPEVPSEAPEIDLTRTRILLETFSRTLRPEFCRDPPRDTDY